MKLNMMNIGVFLEKGEVKMVNEVNAGKWMKAVKEEKRAEKLK